MNYKDFIKNYKKNDIHTYLFYGTERFLIHWAVDQLININIAKGFESMDLLKLDGRTLDIDQLINAYETIPLLSQNRVIVIDGLTDLDGIKGKKFTGVDEKRLLDCFASQNDKTITIVVCEDKVDKRKKLYKEIDKNGKIYTFDQLPIDDLKKWINKRFHQAEKKIEISDITKFIDQSGYYQKDSDYRLYNFENDIKKVVSLSGSNEKIEQQNIQDAISGNIERNVFAIVDAISEGKKSEALRIFTNALTFGEAEYKILALMNRQFENLLKVKILSDSGQGMPIMKSRLKLPDFAIKKLIRLCNKYSLDQLKIINQELYLADKNIKTGVLPPRLSLEMFFSKV